ncbi:hypothetical protein B9W68_05295 [Streptomyces sp. CS227]|uniref:hypothetical protein n=1 Tax=Streptomyces sp. CS227 TaxID=1982763 RepID=UPI000B40BD10|nr:hypothetical protein [Streptomyces sp. CS227]OWA18331.1 hypothetical protein B9W68_05295 [Streptomyces sp. CS227]
MSGRGNPWVGDLVHDEDADRRGIVTDVRGGTVWVLRPEHGVERWTSERPERLALLASREEKRERL